MKHLAKMIAFTACSVVLGAAVLTGCGKTVYITSIEQTAATEEANEFTVTYSDGTTSTFTVNNGADGKDGSDGSDGENGQDGKDVDVAEIYAAYCEEYGDISFEDFLKTYLTLNVSSDAVTVSSIGKTLQSSVKIYTEFVETTLVSNFGRLYYKTNTAMYTGSAVIWEIGKEYTYLVTNYHVIYDSSADYTKNGGYTARKIACYLYGSEGEPVENGTDSDGYTAYDYGSYAVSCEYTGGSVNYDIAVLRVKTSDLKNINENIAAVSLADGYHTGQTAIAVGNPEGEGISVTQGIVSVDSEYITLNIDGTDRLYRSIRIDTALYGGNSGGGLFNADGELIGITNAGDGDDQNVNYAVPLEIVKGAVENILYYDEHGATAGVYTVNTGVNVTAQNSKYVYDPSAGYGWITEQLAVTSVTQSSVAAELSVDAGDILTAIVINGTEYSLTRTFQIADLALTLRPEDTVGFVLQRNGSEIKTEAYTLSASDFSRLY